MKLRYARHTNGLIPIIKFYTQVIGLEILGQFENHSNYDGVFLGFPKMDWHLEFTKSNEPTSHKPDNDDVLVFYFKTQKEISTIILNAELLGFHPVTSKNPYWKINGIEIKDPDGFGVILALSK